jgi:hypothetical protein
MANLDILKISTLNGIRILFFHVQGQWGSKRIDIFYIIILDNTSLKSSLPHWIMAAQGICGLE